MIPSTDQNPSVSFYETLGFEKRADFPWGDGYQWVEIYPLNGTAGFSLVPPGPGPSAGLDTGIILNTDDIDATHAYLRSAEVDTHDEVRADVVGSAAGQRQPRATGGQWHWSVLRASADSWAAGWPRWRATTGDGLITCLLT
jgi:hypothetical protein